MRTRLGPGGIWKSTGCRVRKTVVQPPLQEPMVVAELRFVNGHAVLTHNPTGHHASLQPVITGPFRDHGRLLRKSCQLSHRHVEHESDRIVIRMSALPRPRRMQPARPACKSPLLAL